MTELGFSKEYLNHMLDAASFDHDGVIADTRTWVTNSFNTKYNQSYHPNDLRHFNSVIDWCTEAGLSLAEAKDENRRLWYTPESLFGAKPVDGAIDFLYELHMRRKNYIINSSRIPLLHASTLEWYQTYAPFVEPERIRTGLPDISDGGVTKVYRILTERKIIHFEDVPDQACDVINYTDAHVFLLSNLQPPHLEQPNRNRLTHVKGSGGNLPNFWGIHRLFFG
jgi:hypothetical protein